MIKGLSYTVPAVGRVAIGTIVTSAGGKRMPVKEDHFSITSLCKSEQGWVPHPLHDKLCADQDVPAKSLRMIPIRLIANQPDLNFKEQYTAFDSATGRQLCAGNGEEAKRFDLATGTVATVACPGAAYCAFGQQNRCKLFGRFSFEIEGQAETFGVFTLRTTGYNSVKALRTKLEMYSAYFGGLVGLPLALRLRGKTAKMSMGGVFYFVDLDLRDGVSKQEAAAMVAAVKTDQTLNQSALEDAMAKCLTHGGMVELEDPLMMETEEESDEVEEFLLGTSLEPREDAGDTTQVTSTPPRRPGAGNALQAIQALHSHTGPVASAVTLE